MTRSCLHIRSFRRVYLSVFRNIFFKNGSAGPKSFRGFRETGPRFLEMNCSPPNDKYVDEINCLLPCWFHGGKQELSDPRSVWDGVKYTVKKILETMFDD